MACVNAYHHAVSATYRSAVCRKLASPPKAFVPHNAPPANRRGPRPALLDEPYVYRAVFVGVPTVRFAEYPHYCPHHDNHWTQGQLHPQKPRPFTPYCRHRTHTLPGLLSPLNLPGERSRQWSITCCYAGKNVMFYVKCFQLPALVKQLLGSSSSSITQTRHDRVAANVRQV